MKSITRKFGSSQPAAETAVYLFDDWFDLLGAGVRDRVREFIQAMVDGELDAALMRPRYSRRSRSWSGDADRPVGVTGHRHGHGSRSLMGTFEQTEIVVPCARLVSPDGKTTEWKSNTLWAYQRRTLAADALIEVRTSLAPTRAWSAEHSGCPCRELTLGCIGGVVRPKSARAARDQPSGRHAGSVHPCTGHLEKFLSPSPRESDSVTARGHGRMERASHGAEGLFRC